MLIGVRATEFTVFRVTVTQFIPTPMSKVTLVILTPMKLITLSTATLGQVTLKTRREDNDSVLAKMSEDTINKCWRVPHIYAYFDTRIVRRTNALRADYLGTTFRNGQ